MSERPTVSITTGFGKHVVVLREWLIGSEREYIKQPLLGAVEIQPKIMGKHTSMEVGKIDIEKLMTESDHREITTFVVSVDGSTENILDAVMNMHEDDTAEIQAYIKSKKKLTPEEASA